MYQLRNIMAKLKLADLSHWLIKASKRDDL
jgi:hypothetical protein